MDAVKGAGQDEVVVGVELLQARRKVAVVDEAAGLVDDEQRKHDPTALSSVARRELWGGGIASLHDESLSLSMSLSICLSGCVGRGRLDSWLCSTRIITRE